MTIPNFKSALAECLTDFIGYKQALNCKYRTEANVLQMFDQYLCSHRIPDCELIDSAVIERFLKSRPRRTAGSYNHLLGTMLVFFEWARVHKFIKQNPVKVQPRRETAKRIPYVLDLDDARRLLEQARRLPDNSRGRNRALIYETVFAILYGLGLRVGEVVRLNLGDVDFARDTLFIRETKFGKSRIVPSPLPRIQTRKAGEYPGDCTRTDRCTSVRATGHRVIFSWQHFSSLRVVRHDVSM